jgi:hypothetical protein
MYKAISLLMILSFFLTSCCSIMSHPTRRVMITAQQSNAEVFIDGYNCGTAPLQVDLDKTYNHTIIVSKPGYQSQKACLKSRHTLGSASNIFTPAAGVLVGGGLGAMTGSPYYFLFGSVIGGAVGLGLGIAGTAADLYLRSDCDLNRKGVHFNLIQAN